MAFTSVWTIEEDNKLLKMKLEGRTILSIADELPGRTVASCQDRYRRLTKDHTNERGYGPRPSNEVLEDRDHRLAQDLTYSQKYLGDPVPGRSALDKKVAVATSDAR